jgi:predicted amidophosphoribosyltransferase
MSDIELTGGDVCDECDRETLLTEVECPDCEHEFNPTARVWEVSEMCPACQDEDAPWAEADRRYALWKEREDY